MPFSRFAAVWTATSLAVAPLVVNPGPSASRAAPHQVLLAALDTGTPLYADGSVSCSGADDLSEPVGTVVLQPADGGIVYCVVLRDAAPHWDYYVELSQGGTCLAPQRFYGLTTDENGAGTSTGIYLVGPGSYSILVDVVSDPSSNVPPNPKHREIAPGELYPISVNSTAGLASPWTARTGCGDRPLRRAP